MVCNHSVVGGTYTFFCKMAGRLQAQLQSLSLDGIEEIGEELGRGAYGVVYEVRVSGLVCAGKTLHESIVQVHILANDEMITTSCYLFVE